MGKTIRLNLTGLGRLGPKTRAEIIVEIRHVLGPLVAEAGKRLIITTGNHRGDLNLEFDSDTDTMSKKVCGGGILGEDAGEVVFVRAHKALRVCGPAHPRTGKQDTRRFLRPFWALGPALANTGLHELGHFIANLEHLNDPANFMSTIGPPKEQRTVAVQREFWAGKKMFLADQRKKLVTQLAKEEWLGGFTIQSVPPGGP